MKEIWCVIECSSDGTIYDPDFFGSKEEAIEFIYQDANECYGQSFNPGDANIRIIDGGLRASVWSDEYRCTWEAFEVPSNVARALI